MHGPPWSDQDELLALTVEQLQVISSLLHQAWFKEPHPKVDPVPRPGQNGDEQRQPGEMVEPPRMSSREEIRAFFGGQGVKAVFSES